MTRRYSLYKITMPDGRGYVGATVQPIEVRFAGHVSDAYGVYAHNHGPASIQNAIRLFGPENCRLEHIASAFGPDDAAAAEEALIAQHETMKPAGYNQRAKSSLKGRRRAAAFVPPKIARDWLIIDPRAVVPWPPHAVAA